MNSTGLLNFRVFFFFGEKCLFFIRFYDESSLIDSHTKKALTDEGRQKKRVGVCVCVSCVFLVCTLSGCRTVTAVTQPRSRGGEKDEEGRDGERGGEETGVE